MTGRRPRLLASQKGDPERVALLRRWRSDDVLVYTRDERVTQSFLTTQPGAPVTAPPLRAALVGRGRWGSCIERTLRQLPEFRLCWVCDPAQPKPTHAAPAAGEAPFAPTAAVSDDAQWVPELTRDVCHDVDVVIVATPAAAHVAPALFALAAGKAVFVEKPFATTYSDALELASAAADRVVMVGHLLVYHPAYQMLERLIRQGALGRIERVDVERCSPPRSPPHASGPNAALPDAAVPRALRGASLAHAALTPRNGHHAIERAETHALSKGASSRPLNDSQRCPWWTLAPHDLSILTRLLGAPETLRVRRTTEGVAADLHWSGACASLRYATNADVKVRKAVVTGSLGKVEIDELGPQLTLTRNGSSEPLQLPAELPLMQELRHFAACVREHKCPDTGLEDALQNVRLLAQGAQDMNKPFSVPASDATQRIAP